MYSSKVRRSGSQLSHWSQEGPRDRGEIGMGRGPGPGFVSMSPHDNSAPLPDESDGGVMKCCGRDNLCLLSNGLEVSGDERFKLESVDT